MKIEDKNIDELLIAYLLKELDVESMLEVKQWIEKSDSNQMAYAKMVHVWASAEHSNIEFDTSKAWQAVEKRIAARPTSQKYWWSIAAAVLVLVGFLWFTQTDNPPLQETIVQVGAAKKQVELTDGSIIQLNNYSQISYSENFNKVRREVHFEGTGFFSIKRDTTKVFVIYTENSQVEVLGTSFNIKADHTDSLLTVMVRSGLVRFSYLPEDTSAGLKSVELKIGQKVEYNKKTRQISISKDRVLNQLDTYWLDEKLSFNEVELREVTSILSELFHENIVLESEELAACLITVDFENSGLVEMLDVIAGTFNLKVEHQDKMYLLKGEGCATD